jgi:aminoglycoside phosphotransferase (APT) family kinase protein
MAVTELPSPADAALADRVAAALQAGWPGAAVLGIDRLHGGASSLTYRARLAGGPAADAVVKAAPAGLAPVRNRDVLRQARLLTELAGSAVKVPAVWACDPGDPPECPPLFVMSFEAGSSEEPLHVPAAIPPADVRERSLEAARMLAALHRRDASGLGEPAMSQQKEVERWVRAFGTVPEPMRRGADETAALLLERLPPPDQPVVCHGDWRLGNMLCTGGQVNAVIDWEIWSVGPAGADLAWFLMMCDPTHPAAIAGTETGMAPVADLVHAYESTLGARVPGLGWFRALAAFKQAAVTALLAKHAAQRDEPLEQVAGRLASMLPELQVWAASFLTQRQETP